MKPNHPLTPQEKAQRKKEYEAKYRQKKKLALTPEQKQKASEWMKGWYVRNRERILEKVRQKYWEDPEKHKAGAIKWAKTHKEIVNARQREYQRIRLASMTPEQKRAYLDKHKQYSQKYKARVKPELTPEQIQKKKEYQQRWYQANKHKGLTPEQKQARQDRAARQREQVREQRRNAQELTTENIRQRLQALQVNYLLPSRELTLDERVKEIRKNYRLPQRGIKQTGEQV